jgi:hypothetical protein
MTLNQAQVDVAGDGSLAPVRPIGESATNKDHEGLFVPTSLD